VDKPKRTFRFRPTLRPNSAVSLRPCRSFRGPWRKPPEADILSNLLRCADYFCEWTRGMPSQSGCPSGMIGTDVAAEFATSPSHSCALSVRFDFGASLSALGRSFAVQSMVVRAEQGDRCRGPFRSHRCTNSRAELMNTAPSRSSGGRMEARLQEVEVLRISEIQIVPKDQRGHSTQALKNLSCIVEPFVTRVAAPGRVVLRRCTALSSTERHRPPRATRTAATAALG
jgi:hypothetical protein